MTLNEAIQYKPHPYAYMCIPIGEKSKTMEWVQNVINIKLNVSSEELKAKSRCIHICQARQMYMSYCYSYLGYSLTEVARSIGYHHTTVIHAINVIKEEVRLNTEFGIKYKKTFNL